MGPRVVRTPVSGLVGAHTHERPYGIPTGSPVEQAAMASALSKEGLSGSLTK